MTWASVKRFTNGDVEFSRVLSNSGWLLGSNTLTKALLLLQGIILARILGAEQFGVLALITTYAITVNEVVDSRVWEAAIKYIVQFREKGEFGKATATVKLCYLVDAIAGATAFLIVLLSASIVARMLLKNPSDYGLIQIYSISGLLAIPVGTSTSILRISDHFNLLAYQSVVVAIVRLIGVLFVATAGYGLIAILFVYLIATIVASVILVTASTRAAKELSLLKWHQAPLPLLRDDYREMLRFMFYSNVSGSMRILTSRADVLILGLASIPASVGVYKLAKAFADAVASVFHPIYLAVYPEFSKLAGQGDRLRMRSLQKKLSGMIAIIILPVGLSLTLSAAWIVPWLFGNEFFEAVTPMQILVWQMLWTPLIWFPGYLLAIGRARLLAALNVVDAANYVVLLILLVQMFGITGAAMATVLRLAVWVLLVGLIFSSRSDAECAQQNAA